MFDPNSESRPDATYWHVGDGENQQCVLPHYARLSGHARECGPNNTFVATLAPPVRNCFPSMLTANADPSLNSTNVRCYVALGNRTIGEGRLIVIGKECCDFEMGGLTLPIPLLKFVYMIIDSVLCSSCRPASNQISHRHTTESLHSVT